jgi:SAM-dependent methyltransferase
MAVQTYIGGELGLFSEAGNWKCYIRDTIQQYLGDDVLEVGSGIGATTRIICDGSRNRWVCLEPDPQMSGTLRALIGSGSLPGCCEVKTGTLSDLDVDEVFDTALYIDVLEHIAADGDELNNATRHIRTGGVLLVVAPAHQWLFTSFDQAIGHHRRYNIDTLTEVVPKNFEPVMLRYLDCVGLTASLANRLFLKSSMPTRRQLALWDKMMVPLSRLLDPFFRYRLGKTLVGVWRKRV